MNVQEKVLKFLEEYSLLSETIVVGFSGGQDSLCLLDVLKDLSQQYKYKLIAAHLNHNWRGEESAKEQQLCNEYCKQNNIEFHTKTLEATTKKTELEARNHRYQFFKEATQKYNSKILLTAHTKTDNTETILYRIIKGTGIHGLQGIPKTREEQTYTIFRPLLEFTREETQQYCIEKNLINTCDSSNFDDKYARNNLRLNIIPKLKEINPNFDDAIQNLCLIAQDYQNTTNETPCLPDTTPSKFLKFTSSLQRIIIHKFLIKNELNYDKVTIEKILNFIKETSNKPCGKKLSLSKNKWLFVSANKIEIIKNTNKNQDRTIIIEEYEEDAPKTFPPETSLEALIELPFPKEQLSIRTRKEGDTIQPFGMSGRMKLKKFFINKAIPEHKRDEILLLTHDNEILWAAGVGISEKLRVKSKPTHIIKVEMR